MDGIDVDQQHWVDVHQGPPAWPGQHQRSEITKRACHELQVGNHRGQARAENIHIRDGVSEEAFVRLRSLCNATLEMPLLILPALQVNIRAGAMPPPEANGVTSMKIPLNAL